MIKQLFFVKRLLKLKLFKKKSNIQSMEETLDCIFRDEPFVAGQRHCIFAFCGA